MQIDLNLLLYLVSLAATGGAIMARIGNLEKKVEKHNSLVERMAAAERDIRSAHRRIDELKGGREA